MEYLRHWKCVAAVLLLYFQVISVESFVINNSTSNSQNASESLFLTPYIENGQISEARSASEVTNLPGIGNGFTSYSGYFTVNATYNSNMFFWFFPPLNGDPECPVLLWLEGGPGLPGLNALFDDNGPIQVDVNGTPFLRSNTWIRESGFAVLYVDNPVGTGFSFTDDDAGYSQDRNDISRDLHSALEQFFLVFSEYRNNSFFINGLSYACTFAVTLANLIHESNKRPTTSKINLRGLTIGGGFCALRLEDNYADYLFQMGLIDQNQKRNFTAQQSQLNYLIDTKQYLSAYNVADSLIFGFYRQSYQDNVTGLGAMSILKEPHFFQSLFYFVPWIERPEIRRAIHAGTRPFNLFPSSVIEPLESDIVQSVSPAIETILNLNYPILFYNGNADTLTSPANVENLLLNLNWKGASKFKQASQHIYRVNNDIVAGYIRQADNLYYMMVRNAGHEVIFEQPAVGLDIITRFVIAFVDCTNCDTNDDNNMLFV